MAYFIPKMKKLGSDEIFLMLLFLDFCFSPLKVRFYLVVTLLVCEIILSVTDNMQYGWSLTQLPQPEECALRRVVVT